MAKKVIIAIIVLLLLVIVYNAVVPVLNKPKDVIEEPKLAKAILEFIAEQLNAADLALPAGLQNWKAEDIQITKLENLPGVQGNRRATVKVSGTYLAAGEKDLTKRTPFTTKHLKFIIGKKYPEGISVQFVRPGL
jgi:hypothetical protein